MLLFFFKNVVGVGSQGEIDEGETRLFAQLPPGAGFDGFSVFQMASRKLPGSCTMGIFPFSQKNGSISKDDNANTDMGSFLFVHSTVRLKKFRLTIELAAIQTR